MSFKSNKQKLIIYNRISYLILILAGLMIMYPLLIILSSSFKTEKELFTYPPSLIPESFNLNNFAALLENFPTYILNSFKLTIIIVILQVIIATTSGYAFAKLQWKAREAIFLLYISSIMIPAQVYIIPQFIIIRTIGLYDTHLGLILVCSFTALGTFLVKQFFSTIPDSYIEAAKINGAGHFYIFIKIMLPLSQPVIATLIVLSFRYWWNDLFNPLIYLTSQHLKTLPLGLADFVSEYDVYYGPQMAASLIAIIPVVLIFIFAQKYIIQGFVTSGIKG